MTIGTLIVPLTSTPQLSSQVTSKTSFFLLFCFLSPASVSAGGLVSAGAGGGSAGGPPGWPGPGLLTVLATDDGVLDVGVGEVVSAPQSAVSTVPPS